jgi:dephospho-CoA kinase
VINADALGHEALQTFSDAIVKRFGPEVLEEGRTSRPKLGRIVFADAGQRQALEAILHPAIRRRAEERIATSQAKLVVLDAALLLEADWHTICWCVIMVDAPRETRISTGGGPIRVGRQGIGIARSGTDALDPEETAGESCNSQRWLVGRFRPTG